jgi:N-acetylglucosaminyldiphosphoundecaprenol N-acetyl-beta-D-mannosaminyltransferase
MADEFHGITVCGVYAPPFAEAFPEAENDWIIETIKAARPDVLWVGMTAPKQEKWIFRNRHRLRIPLIAAVGAVFDFFARTKKRAPRWVQTVGMEWLFRFAMEPKRLWSRNLRSSPLFVKMVALEKMRRLRH